MALTRKHYEALADILAAVKDEEVTEYNGYHLTPLAAVTIEDTRMVVDVIADLFARYFADDNPSFDQAKWLRACEGSIHIMNPRD